MIATSLIALFASEVIMSSAERGGIDARIVLTKRAKEIRGFIGKYDPQDFDKLVELVQISAEEALDLASEKPAQRAWDGACADNFSDEEASFRMIEARDRAVKDELTRMFLDLCNMVRSTP
jgi:hypothetical protein